LHGRRSYRKRFLKIFIFLNDGLKIIPFSVIIPDIKSLGVTSKAGLAHFLELDIRLLFTVISSSIFLSSILIDLPDFAAKSNVDIGAAIKNGIL